MHVSQKYADSKTCFCFLKIPQTNIYIYILYLLPNWYIYILYLLQNWYIYIYIFIYIQDLLQNSNLINIYIYNIYTFSISFRICMYIYIHKQIHILSFSELTYIFYLLMYLYIYIYIYICFFDMHCIVTHSTCNGRRCWSPSQRPTRARRTARTARTASRRRPFRGEASVVLGVVCVAKMLLYIYL